MIKVANPFSYNQNFIYLGYLPLPKGFVQISSLKPLAIFHQISHGAFYRSGTSNLLNGFALLNKMAAMLIYGKNTKSGSPEPRML